MREISKDGRDRFVIWIMVAEVRDQECLGVLSETLVLGSVLKTDPQSGSEQDIQMMGLEGKRSFGSLYEGMPTKNSECVCKFP